MAAPDEAKRDLIPRLQQLPMRHRWLRWTVLAGSLAFSAASTYYFGAQVRQEAHSRFETVAVGVANGVNSRIRAYGDVLYALRGLFDSSNEVTRDEFHQFAQALSLGERYPGVTNISFSFRVPHARKLQFERAVRAEKSPLVKGLPEFAIKPPGDRPEYAVLSYLEPMGKNVAAWGLDLNADPLRRSAVDRARDSGQISASSAVTLLRDGNASVASTLLRLAVYRGGGVPGSVEERQRLYSGIVGSAVRVGAMIDATLSKEVLARAELPIYEAGASAARGAVRFGRAARSAAAGRSPRSCSTSTTSRASTTRSATKRAISYCGSWRARSGAPREGPTSPAATEARNSWCCCPSARSTPRCAGPSACARKLQSSSFDMAISRSGPSPFPSGLLSSPITPRNPRSCCAAPTKRSTRRSRPGATASSRTLRTSSRRACYSSRERGNPRVPSRNNPSSPAWQTASSVSRRSRFTRGRFPTRRQAPAP